MQQNQTLLSIIALIQEGYMGMAIRNLENYLLTYQLQADMERLQTIKQEYDLMKDYWLKGYVDPERNQLYRQLLRRMYVLTSNMLLNDRLRSSPFLKNLYSRPRHHDREWSLSAIRRQMESFVSEQALLGLEPEHVRHAKGEHLYHEHSELMDDLFDYIVTSRLWSDTLADAFEQMLLTPTIDTVDQQLIVAAIMLSAMQAFGFNKFRVLANVYCKTDDEALRQRALVGWVLVLDDTKTTIYPELLEMVRTLCSDERTQQELTELQMQLVYCMEAEDDGQKIRNEIIPDLMKGSNIKLTRQGLEEIDEDSLEDILHPEAAEQNMEQMENSMHRMVDMQKQGADIYFGGFSQMKRFPFFNSPSNWFVPFYTEHPAISDIWKKARGKRFLELVTDAGAFCDSDKYSFVLAFNQVVERLPQSMLSMIEQGEASPVPMGGEIALEEQRQPAFIRRVYLQNIYRFFRLFVGRSEFVDPFANARRHVFFSSRVFNGTDMQKRMVEVAAFLMKHKRIEEVQMVLDNIDDAHHNYQYYMLKARVATHEQQRSCYERALAEQPKSEQALAGYARACFRDEMLDEAINAYEQLVKSYPDKESYLLSLAACLSNSGRISDSEPILFKLNYLHPDNQNVTRVLAWTLMAGGKYEQADKYYLQLTDKDARREDLINHAICRWLMNRVESAVQMFSRIDTPLQELIEAEREFLSAHGISQVEIQLMLDAAGDMV